MPESATRAQGSSSPRTISLATPFLVPIQVIVEPVPIHASASQLLSLATSTPSLLRYAARSACASAPCLAQACASPKESRVHLSASKKFAATQWIFATNSSPTISLRQPSTDTVAPLSGNISVALLPADYLLGLA
eukprot:5680947-Pleurochrysis_carterae.AAC.1